MSRISFNKPWISHPDQVAVLERRGLIVPDRAAAAEYLSHINYYRFSGYCLAYEAERHRFLPNVTFDQVRETCEFDRDLRDFVAAAVEAVEIDLRTAVANQFGRERGPFGHANSRSFFTGAIAHAGWLERLRDDTRRSTELFVAHYREHYAEFPDLPIWMATEIMSFGSLSLMFRGMRRTDQRAISHRYRLQPTHLQSILHHLVYVRNLCAHHSRLWDRIWSIKPNLPPGKIWTSPLLTGNSRLFTTLVLLMELLSRCPAIEGFRSTWSSQVLRHIETRMPAAPAALERMGLTANWQEHPSWA